MAEDGWLLMRAVKDTNDDLEQFIEQTIRWNLSGCIRCSSIYEILGTIPVHCDVCGTRDANWMTWVNAAAQLAQKGGVVYTIAPVNRTISDEVQGDGRK